MRPPDAILFPFLDELLRMVTNHTRTDFGPYLWQAIRERGDAPTQTWTFAELGSGDVIGKLSPDGLGFASTDDFRTRATRQDTINAVNILRVRAGIPNG
jgi:hypothetical protein